MTQHLERTDGRAATMESTELGYITHRAMFWRPDFLEPSPWLEHAPLAFWLCAAHQPRVLVEVSRGAGVSYFAFCQAVDRLGLDTRCFVAAEAPKEPDEAFEAAREHNMARYSAFSRLLTGDSGAQLDQISDGSVDLLHLDLELPARSLEQAYRAWSPKLSSRAIVLLHGIHGASGDSGARTLAESLSATHPSLEFPHGDGLLLVGVGARQGDDLRRLLGAAGDDGLRRGIHEVFARLGRACADGQQASAQSARARELARALARKDRELAALMQAAPGGEPALRAERDSLRESLAQARDEAASLARQLAARGPAASDEELAELRARVQALGEEREKFAGREAVFTKLRVDAERRAADAVRFAREEKKAMESELASLREAVAAASRNRETAGEIEQALEAHKEQVSSLRLELANAEARAAELEQAREELEQARKEFESQASQVRELESRVEALFEERDGALSRTDALEAENERLQAEVSAVNARLRDELAEAQSRAAEAREVAGKAIKAYQAVREQQKQSLAAIEASASAQAAIADELEQARALLATAQGKMEERERIESELKNKLREGEESRRKLQDGVDLRFREIAALTRMLVERDAEIESLRDGTREQDARDRLGLVHAAAAAKREREALASETARLAGELARVGQSWSWRLTAPLRGALALVRGGRGGGITAGSPLADRRAEMLDLLRQSGLVDADWYLANYPDVAAAEVDPVEHYLEFGAVELRDPGPGFSSAGYLSANPDVAEAGINPLLHYIEHGRAEGRPLR